MYYQDMHTPQNAKNVHELDQFFVDIKDGKLAQFTWWVLSRCAI